MFRYIAAIFVVTFALNSNAQLTYDFQFEANRDLDPAFRIAFKPTIIDTVFAKPEAKNELLPIKKEVEIETMPIQAANIKVSTPPDKLYPGYAVLGIGNYLMPLGELYFNETRSKQYHWGVGPAIRLWWDPPVPWPKGRQQKPKKTTQKTHENA